MIWSKIKSLSILSLLLIAASCGPINTNLNLQEETEDPSVPPGTVKLTETLYIDRVPVTNMMYGEFLDHLEKYWSLKKHEEMKTYANYGLDADTVFAPYNGSTRLLMSAQVDPYLFVQPKLDVNNYMSHSYYQWHPVVHASQEQAALFCKWRTDMVNAVYGIRSRKEGQRSNYPAKVNYRLPSENEMKGAQNLLDKKLQLLTYQDDIYSYYGDFFKFKRIQDETHMAVFEMKELSKNGAYFPLYKALSYYEADELNTGFRCICEVTP